MTNEDILEILQKEFPEADKQDIIKVISQNEKMVSINGNVDHNKVYSLSKYYFKTNELKERGLL